MVRSITMNPVASDDDTTVLYQQLKTKRDIALNVVIFCSSDQLFANLSFKKRHPLVYIYMMVAFSENAL